MDTVQPNRTDARGYTGFVLGTAGAAVFAAVGLLLNDRVPAMDTWSLRTLRVEPDSSAETLVAVTSDGLRAVSVAAAAVAIGWLLWRKRRRASAPALGYLVLFLLLTSSSEFLKEVFDRPHPTDPADVSYPSTHLVMVTVAVVIIGAILRVPGRRNRLGMIVLATAVVTTAATRVMLAEHHITDVLGTAIGYAGAAMLGVMLLRRSAAASL